MVTPQHWHTHSQLEPPPVWLSSGTVVGGVVTGGSVAGAVVVLCGGSTVDCGGISDGGTVMVVEVPSGGAVVAGTLELVVLVLGCVVVVLDGGCVVVVVVGCEVVVVVVVVGRSPSPVQAMRMGTMAAIAM